MDTQSLDRAGLTTVPLVTPESVPPSPRFLTLQQVADELNTSHSQVYALVRDRSLLAVKIGGRGQWRVERAQLEAYIARLYREADARDPGDLPAGARPGALTAPAERDALRPPCSAPAETLSAFAGGGSSRSDGAGTLTGQGRFASSSAQALAR